VRANCCLPRDYELASGEGAHAYIGGWNVGEREAVEHEVDAAEEHRPVERRRHDLAHRVYCLHPAHDGQIVGESKPLRVLQRKQHEARVT
jgi:hypothetical protein